MFKHMTVLPVAIGLFAAAGFAQPTIEQIAPDNSIVVAGVNDFQKSLNAIKGTPLWALWKSDEVTAMFEEPMEEMHDELDDTLEELGLEEGDLSWPQGPVGLAIFPGKPGDPGGMVSGPGYLAMADYGLKALDMNRIVEALLDRVREEHHIEIPEQEILGRTVYTINLTELAGEELDLDPAEELDDMNMPPMVDPAKVLEQFSVAHLVRDGRRFLVSSDLAVLREALELIDDDGKTALTDRADYRGAMKQIGETDGFAMVLVRDLAGLMPGDPTIMMTQMMFQQVVGDIQALAFGVHVGNSDVMVEETMGAYMPNGKTGLSTLMAVETPQGKVPPFVGPGCVAYSRFNFQFDGVMGFLRNLCLMNPMIGAQLNPMLVEYGPKIEKVCSALGPEVHSTVRIARPLSLDSLKTLYAIQSSRPDDVEAVLAEYAAGLGLEPRDFIGHRIYSMDVNPLGMAMGAGMGGEGFSLGFGGGFVMFGNTSAVEDALRATARADMPQIGDDAAYRRALRALTAPRSVGWGVMNMVDYLDFMKNLGPMLQAEMLEQVKEWDPEYAQELEQEMAAQPETPWEDFDVKMLNRYMGPLSWEIRSRDDGFVVRYLVLGPAGDK